MWSINVVIAILSLILGICFVEYLTTHPLHLNRIFGEILLVSLILLSLFMSISENSQIFIGLTLFFGGFICGYIIDTLRVLNKQELIDKILLTRSPTDPGKSHTAIIYFTHGEPETYNPMGWLNQFREFDAQKIPFIPKFIRPFFLYSLRKHYLQVGCSFHRRTHIQMLHHLEQLYRQEGDLTTRFYISFLDDTPHPNQAIIQALNDGASQIIVAEIFVTISNHTSEGEEQINHVMQQFPNILLHFTGPFWDSELLHTMFVNRVEKNRKDLAKSDVGVVLVGHGQPDIWDQTFPTETIQEIEFRNLIKKKLEQAGYDLQKIGLAWMEFKKPHPKQIVEQIATADIKALFYFAATISADSIHSQYDIPMLVNKANISKDIQLINLGAWNDDIDVINAIKLKIDRFK